MAEWCNRPLESVYPVVFIDAIFVKIRDGQVANRPIYVVIGVTCAGGRDILGLWAGDGGEGAKFWLAVLTEIKNRGTADVCMVVCDGLKGLSEAVGAVWDGRQHAGCAGRTRRGQRRGRRTPGRRGGEKAAGDKQLPKVVANTTDPQSRIMPTRKAFPQGYNTQIAVTADQLIVAVQVGQSSNDQACFLPMLRAAQDAAARIHSATGSSDHVIGVVLADAGYNSDAT